MTISNLLPHYLLHEVLRSSLLLHAMSDHTRLPFSSLLVGHVLR